MKKKDHILWLLFSCTLTLSVVAQQTPTFAEYNYNPFIINAAYAGVLDGAEITLSNAGLGGQDFQGAPSSLSLTANTPLRNQKMGLGAGYIRDKIGVTTSTRLFAAYSYKVILNDNAYPYWKLYDRSFVSFGITAGALIYDQDLLSLGIQNDPDFATNINTTLPNVGIGALFGQGNFFIGASMPNVLGNDIFNQDNLKLSNPIYGYTGYNFATNRFNEYIVKPSLLFKYEQGAPVQVDMNLALSVKNIFEIGAGFRTSNTFSASAGFYVFKNMRILYNYSQGTTASPLGNTHGILLSYKIGEGYKKS